MFREGCEECAAALNETNRNTLLGWLQAPLGWGRDDQREPVFCARHFNAEIWTCHYCEDTVAADICQWYNNEMECPSCYDARMNEEDYEAQREAEYMAEREAEQQADELAETLEASAAAAAAAEATAAELNRLRGSTTRRVRTTTSGATTASTTRSRIARCVSCQARATFSTLLRTIEGTQDVVCTACIAEHYHQCAGCMHILGRKDNEATEVYIVPTLGYENNRRGPIRDTPLCRTCVQHHAAACNNCRTLGMSNYMVNGVCKPCLDTMPMQCSVCSIDTVQSNGRRVSITRFIEPDHSVEIETGDEQFVCTACTTRRIANCRRHGTWWMVPRERTESEILIGAGTGRCPQCIWTSAGKVHQYSYKPEPEFFSTLAEGVATKEPWDDLLAFGIELEVEIPQHSRREDIVRAVASPWWYAKSDSSMAYGIEFVTHPMTFAFIQQEQTEISAKLKTLLELGCTSHSTTTCGMHIHMSKNQFTSFHLYKFMRFIYENPEFSLLISQRQLNRLNEYASLTTENKALLARKARRKLGNLNANRRVAVNLENAHTVELRMFRGNLRADRFYKNIEYCHAVFMFSKEVGLDELTEAKFRTWVERNKSTYPNLQEFLIARTNPQTEGEMVAPVKGKPRTARWWSRVPDTVREQLAEQIRAEDEASLSEAVPTISNSRFITSSEWISSAELGPSSSSPDWLPDVFSNEDRR